MLRSDPGQRPARKALPEQPSCCWWEIQTSSGQSDQGHPRALDSAEQRRGLGEAAITLTTPYRQSGAISPPLPGGCAQGIARPCSINSSSWEATTTSAWLRCRPPGAGLNSRAACERSGRSGPTAQAFSPEKPWQRAARNGHMRESYAAVGGLRGALAPAAEAPGVQKNLHRLAARKHPGGRGAASWQSARRFFAPATSPGEDLGQLAMSCVVVQTATGRARAVPRAGRQPINKTCGCVHPALLEGRKPPSP